MEYICSSLLVNLVNSNEVIFISTQCFIYLTFCKNKIQIVDFYYNITHVKSIQACQWLG